MTAYQTLALGLVLLYCLFLFWYGGTSKPVSLTEGAAYLKQLQTGEVDPHSAPILQQLQTLIQNDDGREFVMQNLVRHRTRALYPPGSPYSDDARAADQRYGRAILWPLLKRGNLVLFVATRRGSFIEPEGADPWHYVAMVRYRSLRDFLEFAVAINRDEIIVHKWAAIEKTHVFPVRPMVSLALVRTMVGLLLGLIGVLIGGLITLLF